MAVLGAHPRWLFVVALGSGCFQPDVYACVGDGSCDAGTCEPTGFCSYPDDACDSGRRYSELAGDGLAGACVEPIAGTDGSSSSSSSGDATTLLPTSESSSTTEDDPSTGAPGVCGDGNVDPGEACDDENLDPGDGCSPDCVVSGTILWEQFHADPFGADDAALALAILAPDDVVVAGNLQTAADTRVGFYARHAAADGELAWVETFDDVELPSDLASGIVVNASNDIIVGGGSGVWPSTTRAWVRAVGPGGDELWTVAPNLRSLACLAPNGGGAIAAGSGIVSTGPDVYAAVVLSLREIDGAQQWRVPFPAASSFNAIARVGADNFLAATIPPGDMALVRGGESGLVELDRIVGRFGGEDRGQAVAVLGGTEAVALAGFIGTAAGNDWWLRAYDENVQERWTQTDTELPLAFSDEIEGLVFAPDGSIVVTGMLTRVDKDMWVARFDPAGEIVWSRVLPPEADNVGDDTGRAIAFTLDGSIAIAGERTRADGGRDAWVVKLVP